MTHLRDTEFVDLLDGTLPPLRLAHLQGCEACRKMADETRASLATVASAAHVAEPSPLFWEHFTRRVNDAIDAPPPAQGWFSRPRFALAMLATLTVILLTITLVTSRIPSNPARVAVADVEETDNLDADADWAIVRAAADDLELDDAQAAGLGARPGTADKMALELTAAERAELIRLVQAEFKSGA